MYYKTIRPLPEIQAKLNAAAELLREASAMSCVTEVGREPLALLGALSQTLGGISDTVSGLSDLLEEEQEPDGEADGNNAAVKDVPTPG